MRMLFTSTPGFGSFHPVVALAQAARAAGHDVAFAITEQFRPVIERLDMTFLPAGLDGREVRAMMLSRYPDVPLPPIGIAGRKLVIPALFGDAYVHAMLPGLLEACKEWRAEVVVRAHLAYAGLLAAEECGVPCVAVEEWASGIPGWERENMNSTLNAWRARRSLPEVSHLSPLDPYLILVPFPAPLRHPGAPFGPTARRIRPLIFSDSTDDPLPDWIDSLPDAPVVHASLGTAFERPELLRAIIDGVAGEPFTLVLASGPLSDPAAFEPLPANVRAATYISHSQLLPRCDAIITHAGAGTLIAAVNEGLPMVLVPLFGDQLWNAERASAAGAGILLDPAQLTPDSVRGATRSVISDRRYREGAHALRREIDALPTHNEAVEWIEQIARTKSPLRAGT